MCIRDRAGEDGGLEIGREPLDRADQIIRQHRIECLACQQRRIGPVGDDDPILRTPYRLDGVADLHGMRRRTADRDPALGVKRGDPADRMRAGAGIEQGSPGRRALEILDIGEPGGGLQNTCLL